MKQARVTIDAAEWARGEQQLIAYANGNGLGKLGDHFLAYATLAVRVERLNNITALLENIKMGKLEQLPSSGLDVWVPPHINHPDGLRMAERAQRWLVNHNGLGDVWLAARHVLRNTVTTSRLIQPPGKLAGPSGDQLGIAWPIAFAVVGLAAAAAGYYYGKDRNEKEAEIANMALAANVDQYLKNIEARILTGQTIPPPPPQIQTMASQERNYPMWTIGAAVVLGGVAALGVMNAFSRRPVMVNPSRKTYTPRSRQLPARRANPSKKTAAPKRRRRAAKSNPLKTGHSRETISANISRLRAEGKPPSVAVAASLRSARAAYRKKHPTGKFPAYLQPPKQGKAAPKRKATTKRKANPSSSGVIAIARNAYPSAASYIDAAERRIVERLAKQGRMVITKRGKWRGKTELYAKLTASEARTQGAPTTRANPKRKANPKTAKPSKAAFIAKQKRKGRSPAQAAADWKGKQRIAKMRTGKARRRR